MSTSLGNEYAVQKETTGWLTTGTILLLMFVPPGGLICMWQRTNWSKTVKWVITVCWAGPLTLLGVLRALVILAVLVSNLL